MAKIWETIAAEVLENLGDMARDILAERRAEGDTDSADDVAENFAYDGTISDEVESARAFIYMSEGEAFEDIANDEEASEFFKNEVEEWGDLFQALRVTVARMAEEATEEALADLADALREDFPDLEEDDYGEEASL